ncbi:IS3 family transposase [Ewingella americana]|nr:IS3 family transposase [Ewingella americana]
MAALFHYHKGRYGYRRITRALRNEVYGINHKTVRKLMCKMGWRHALEARNISHIMVPTVKWLQTSWNVTLRPGVLTRNGSQMLPSSTLKGQSYICHPCWICITAR